MRTGFPMILFYVFDRIRKVFRWVVCSVCGWILCAFWGVVHGKNCKFIGRTLFRTHRRGEIVLGNGIRLFSTVLENPVGLTGPSILDTRRGGRIVIGDGSGLSSPVISSMVGVTIGKYCKIGGNARIFDHNFHGLDPDKRRMVKGYGDERPKPITIEDDVFIGTNAIILKGTHIGARSVVAAGSVVFGLHIPPDSLVKGNPAVICERKR